MDRRGSEVVIGWALCQQRGWWGPPRLEVYFEPEQRGSSLESFLEGKREGPTGNRWRRSPWVMDECSGVVSLGSFSSNAWLPRNRGGESRRGVGGDSACRVLNVGEEAWGADKVWGGQGKTPSLSTVQFRRRGLWMQLCFQEPNCEGWLAGLWIVVCCKIWACPRSGTWALRAALPPGSPHRNTCKVRGVRKSLTDWFGWLGVKSICKAYFQGKSKGSSRYFHSFPIDSEIFWFVFSLHSRLGHG